MSSRGTARCVIVVEDDDRLRKAMKGEFEDSFEVRAAADAAAAGFLVDAAEDLVAVVSDYNLGEGVDGVELLAKLRSERPTVARLLVSGSTLTKAIMAGLADGTVQALVEKPWTPGELCKLVESLNRPRTTEDSSKDSSTPAPPP